MAASEVDQFSTACARGEETKVKEMLENGVYVNGLNKFGRTALQVGKMSKAKQIRMLIQAGADPNLADPTCGLTPLHDAARDGFEDSARALLEGGADANAADVWGNLPLHLAAQEGHVGLLRLLLPETSDPRRPNRRGLTALQLALMHRRPHAARYLLESTGAQK